MDFTRSTSVRKLATIESALKATPMTIRQMAVTIFASESGLFQYFGMLHETKQIHISGWHTEVKTRYETKLPIYSWGSGRDARKPARKTPLACYHERMAKMSKSSEEYKLMRDRKNARRRKPKIDPLVSALFSREPGSGED